MQHISEILEELGPDPNPEEEPEEDENWEDVQSTDDEEEGMDAS